jgi:DNA-binding protein HU-beta
VQRALRADTQDEFERGVYEHDRTDRPHCKQGHLAAAGRALEAIVGGIRGSLRKGNAVTLVGFGTFSVGKRAARTGRNPRTNEPIKIKAAKVVKFRPGKALKDSVN